MTDTYSPTARTTATRNRARMRYDRDLVHSILDEAYDCSVAFVVDGEPRVLPTLHARVGGTLFLHGSSGGRLGLSARDGTQVCVSVTLVDGIVYARSQMHHSANYRSVVAHGRARLVTDPAEKLAAMTALVDKFGSGRAADSRPPTRKEMAETSLLALVLDEVSARVRTGGVVDEEADLTLPHWAGVLPIRRVGGPPETDEGVAAAPPAYLGGTSSPWQTAATMTGRHVRLEQLTPGHVDGLFAALDDAETWEFLSAPCPAHRDQIGELVTGALRAQWLGERVPWVQLHPQTGEVMGTTMYHDVDEPGRVVAIGHSMLGRRWWRSGVNTESKLLLLERAFEVLGAERVFWYTDIRNERSQRAIARLGASRDGLIRRHRLRPDGTWRDSVYFAMTADEWPAARGRLRERLAAAETAAEAKAAAGADADAGRTTQRA
ncbi:bifunctional pyridoxamine 5'-phosphate oxidase family protein/GNAT family N-acetyltransferase [Actinoplanes sp. NPDC051470]|uniref:bifunctional pyridoxamine 5'-phosphate oxidase family protein/GNAT family N-acetyltransferase n=1 Tax=Actinoplanes sp. NPDC051470 TaxID=3157224 RepID=UPI00343C0130